MNPRKPKTNPKRGKADALRKKITDAVAETTVLTQRFDKLLREAGVGPELLHGTGGLVFEVVMSQLALATNLLEVGNRVHDRVASDLEELRRQRDSLPLIFTGKAGTWAKHSIVVQNNTRQLRRIWITFDPSSTVGQDDFKLSFEGHEVTNDLNHEPSPPPPTPPGSRPPPADRGVLLDRESRTFTVAIKLPPPKPSPIVETMAIHLLFWPLPSAAGAPSPAASNPPGVNLDVVRTIQVQLSPQ